MINDFRVEWARGFGVREAGSPEPISERTLFQAASISKPIFALAVMRLVQDGKLDLDTDVSRYLTSWRVPSSGAWTPRVTLGQILSHSAGFTGHGFEGYRTTEKLPSVIDVLDGRAPSNSSRVEVNIVPGTLHRYSGGGITVAQQLVVDALGKPFPLLMRKLVLDPVGMRDSTYDQPLPKSWEKRAATAHPFKGTPLPGKWHVYPEMAAAGLWTTPTDLARAGLELQLALNGDPNRLLSQETAAAMLTAGISEEIGIGFFLTEQDKVIRFGHGGWNEGFVAKATFFKDLGMGAVIMVNSNAGYPLLDEIERAIAREYDWPGYFPHEKVVATVAPEQLDAYAGDYATTRGLKMTVRRRDGSLLLNVEEQPELEMFPESDTAFFARNLNVTATFEKAESGEVKALVLDQEGVTTAAEKRRP